MINTILASKIVPGRQLNSLYILLDTLFLIFFMGLLIYKKNYLTAIFAFAGGVIYFFVDYGLFYKLLGIREVIGANTFWFLMWLSMSYGITNFGWIWLCLKKDEHLKEWTILIMAWWICCPLIAQRFGQPFGEIIIRRGTSDYHGIMALFLIVGYSAVCIYNMVTKKEKINILMLMLIGILAQFGWEFALLVTGIRTGGINTLIINSLVETNMGLPWIYFIYKGVSKLYNEDLSLVVEEKQEVVTLVEEVIA